ncbi:TIGR04149 family rSAM-modified RiPP [Parabacteroides sp. OttesenSCG-928-G07]|nr:TIGR04149 family rSAM-modified RiPP [Parabacteroides sp. OttesenSCG-928-G21]MDL2277487.1 TIGR04149 family rSAM-modified RiPP [Parabacteroides sp. OttesenSCG-928-G07]
MKKLTKIVLKNQGSVLSDQEMKMITGGSIMCKCWCSNEGYSYDGYCAFFSIGDCENKPCAGSTFCISTYCWEGS